MRAGFFLAVGFSLLLVSVSSEAKVKTSPKEKAQDVVNVSGYIVKDSCNQDTTINRSIVFVVEDRNGKTYSCCADANHPKNADWGYLKTTLAIGKYICLSGMLDENKKYFSLVNIKTCDN